MFFNVHLNLKLEHLRSSTDSLHKHGGRKFNPRPAVWQNTAASEPLLLELVAHFFYFQKKHACSFCSAAACSWFMKEMEAIIKPDTYMAQHSKKEAAGHQT